MFYTQKTIDEKLEALDLRLAQLLKIISAIDCKIADAIEAHEAKKVAAELKKADDRQNSDVPFVEIISDGYDPELGVQLQLDWNAAFIKELKSKGYRGRNERDIVNKWLTAVHKQLANEFEEDDKV